MPKILYSLSGADQSRHYSPHVWKIIMSLKHKGLDFEIRSVFFNEIPTIEDGSFKSVPVFNDNGRLFGDSFDIAVHLEEAYPQTPSLFEGEGGKALSRFFESFSLAVLHPPISKVAVMDMHAMMSPDDQAYFRAARERRFNKPLEEVGANGVAEVATFAEKLAPMRSVLATRPFFGGESPLFADYVLFGALQWARICTPSKLLPEDDPVTQWFERCLDLYGGVGRSVASARDVSKPGELS